MKIAFDAKRYFNNTTGLGFYSRTLVDGLRRYFPEHEYQLYTPYHRGTLVSNPSGIQLPDRPLGRVFHPLWRSKWIVNQLKRNQVEIFHGLSHELPIGLKKAGIPSVVTMHDLIFMRYPELYPRLDRFFYQKKYRQAANEADIVVAISEQTKLDLENFFNTPPEKIRVIGQSCDPVFGQYSLLNDPKRERLPLPENLQIPHEHYLIAVGSLTPRKNWHRLIEAIALVQQVGFQIPLVAVGTGNSAYAQSLPELAKQHQVEVFWLNQHIASKALAALYQRATALVYPSVFEGFGIPILEALTVGIPVVTTRGGCFEEVGGGAALYADPLSPMAIAQEIIKVLDTQNRQTLLAAAPAQIRQFDPEQICREWIGVYQSLVAD